MNKEKIRDVALRIWNEDATEADTRTGDKIIGDFAVKLVAELSKDVEPVAEISLGHTNCIRWLQQVLLKSGTRLYLHPPLTEQDKLDAEQWRAYQKRKQDLLDRGFLRNPLR